MERRDALRLLAILPLTNEYTGAAQLFGPKPTVYQVWLKKGVPVEVFYEGEKVTLDPAEIFAALKHQETA